MKKKTIILTLAITLTMSVGSLAYAQGNNSSEFSPKTKVEGREHKTPHGKEHLGLGGKEFREKVLIEKFKISQEEIDKTRADGKRLVDLIKEKGITYEQYKTAALEVKYGLIDKAVSEGKITQEKAKEMKEKIKTRMDSKKDFGENLKKEQINTKEKGNKNSTN